MSINCPSFEFLLFLLKQCLIALLFLLVFAGLGRSILTKFNVTCASIFEEFFFSISLGMVLTVIYISFLALTGMLYKPLLLFLLTGLIGLKYVKITKEYFYIFILFLILFPSVLLTLYPPFYWDDTGYHLPLAQAMLENHRLVFDKFLIYPVFPLNGDILLISGLSLDALTAQLIPWLCFFTLSAGCFSEIKKRSGYLSALIASGLFLSNQILIFFSVMCYIDTVVALFITCTVIGLCNFFHDKDKKWLYISGIFLGISLGTKYIAIIFLVIISVLLVLFKKRKELLIYTLIVMIFACPWYIRNFYYTGNPVWPVLGGGTLWTSTDYARQIHDLKYSGPEKTWINFLKFPLYLSQKYSYHGNAIVLNPLIWPGLILQLYYKNHYSLIFLFISMTFTLCWFFTTNLVRYYIAGIAVITIASAAGLSFFMESLKNKKIRIIFSIFLLVLNLTLFYSFTYSLLSSRGTIPVNDEEREVYLLKSWPSY
ncbi:MAG: phospholipid carrier-dependent glycosyltransferase, partial [Candidatus Eremiobacterota bacterium]